MSPEFHLLIPPAHQVRRWLWHNRSGAVALCHDLTSGWTAVKLIRSAPAGGTPAALRALERLQPLTKSAGWLPVLAFGPTLDPDWVWYASPVADDTRLGAIGQGFLLDDAGLANFEAAHLRLRVQRDGALGAEEVLRLGIRLGLALGTLHQAGLVHRDVKPSNLFYWRGEVCLGDHGLVTAPGTGDRRSGTEGYLPPEGGADAAADAFALGRTLYEVWTGLDRLEFPSLPPRLRDAPTWDTFGRSLNAVLCRACHPDPRQRFRDTQPLVEALRRALAGAGLRVTRRQMLGRAALALAGAASIPAVVTTWQRRRSPPILAHWQRLALLPRPGILPADWTGNRLFFDAVRDVAYSFHVPGETGAIHTIDPETGAIHHRPLQVPPKVNELGCWILHPEENAIWALDRGCGPVWRVEPETGAFSRVGGVDMVEKFHGSVPCWNTHTGRLLVFGGYGWFRVYNWLWEYDPRQNTWTEIQPHRPGTGPWPRHMANLLEDPSTGDFWLFGGTGSRMGEQGNMEPGLHRYHGHFPMLGDLWRFTPETGSWVPIVDPPGLLGEHRPKVLALGMARPQCLLLFESFDSQSEGAQSRPPAVLACRPGVDATFLPVTCVGQVPNAMRTPIFPVYDPHRERMLVVLRDGVFACRLEFS